jgi:hypothetical protein
MESLKRTLSNAVRAVYDRQQLLIANLTANAFLSFVAYSWFVLNGPSGGELVDSLLVLLPTAFLVCWLQATTFAAFHPGVTEIPFLPVLSRLHRFAPWAALLAGNVILFAWMSSLLGYWVWIIGMAVLLALLPLSSQAAGGWFARSSAIDVIFDEEYWMIATGLLVAGLYLPFLVFMGIPQMESLIGKAIINGLRVGISYLLAVVSWVVLAAVVAEMAVQKERAKDAKQAVDQTVTPNRPFSKNAITMEKTRNQTSQ